MVAIVDYGCLDNLLINVKEIKSWTPELICSKPELHVATTDLTEQLTPRQAAFVAEYLIDLNGVQAAIRAGYAENSTGEATRLLDNARVRAAIERGKAQRTARVNITQDTVLNEMATLALSDISHYVITDDGQVALAEGAPSNAMAAVQSIKRKTTVKANGDRVYDVEIRLWDKPAPLKLTGRHVGLFPDRVELTGPGGKPLEITAIRREIVREELEEAK